MYSLFCIYSFSQLNAKCLGAFAFKISGCYSDGVGITFGISSNDISRQDAIPLILSIFAYCFVDFYVYFIGLYVIQKYGSSTMAVASTLQIPIQQAVYCSFLVRKYIERFYLSDLFALILVLVGYYLFEFSMLEGRMQNLS